MVREDAGLAGADIIDSTVKSVSANLKIMPHFRLNWLQTVLSYKWRTYGVIFIEPQSIEGGNNQDAQGYNWGYIKILLIIYPL